MFNIIYPAVTEFYNLFDISFHQNGKAILPHNDHEHHNQYYYHVPVL